MAEEKKARGELLMKIQTGIGFSKSLEDAFEAGREAATAAIARLAGETPALIKEPGRSHERPGRTKPA